MKTDFHKPRIVKKHVLQLLVLSALVLLPFCASKKNYKKNFPQEIVSMSFEKWNGGREELGSGATIFIDLKKPLQKNIHLKKIYFQNQESAITKDNETRYSSNFHSNTVHNKFHSSDVISKNFELKDNEAVIEYQKHNKIYFLKCINIKETPMIMYE